MYRIHSSISDREIVFSNKEVNWFDVEIFSSTLRCSHSVWHDETHPRVDEFFRELAAFRKPWDDERIWESLEGDLRISASCSRTGNVHLSINIKQHMGGDEESNITTGVIIELGQLSSTAEGMRDLFKK
jgi:hypothetical protein